MSERDIDRALVWDRAVRAFQHAVNPDWDGFNLRPDPEDPHRFLADGELLRYEIDIDGTHVRVMAILNSNGKTLLDRSFVIA